MKTGIEEFIGRFLENARKNKPMCDHVTDIQVVSPSSTEGCEACLKVGDRWVHLRVCLSCGYVGCCDSSKNQHAHKHYNETGHSMILSYEPAENWVYCYEDDVATFPAM